MQVVCACQRGANRSGGLVVGFLMCACQISVRAALKHVQDLRCIVWIETPPDRRSREWTHFDALEEWQMELWAANRSTKYALQDICVLSCRR